jgi:hypothetical protein
MLRAIFAPSKLFITTALVKFIHCIINEKISFFSNPKSLLGILQGESIELMFFRETQLFLLAIDVMQNRDQNHAQTILAQK